MSAFHVDSVYPVHLSLFFATRICGSDLHNYLAGGVGGRPVTEPLVMGHESAGEVIAVGDRVTTHKVGDRVAGELGGFSGSY